MKCPICHKRIKPDQPYNAKYCMCPQPQKPRKCKKCENWLFVTRENLPKCTCHVSNGLRKAEMWSKMLSNKPPEVRLTIHVEYLATTPSKVERNSKRRAIKRNLKAYYDQYGKPCKIIYIRSGHGFLRNLKKMKRFFDQITRSGITFKHFK